MVMRRARAAAFFAFPLALLIAASCSPRAKKQDPAQGASAEGAAVAVETTEWDFGSIRRGETVTRAVGLSNNGAAEVEVVARSTCTCLTAEPESQTLGPGESASLLLSFLGEDIKEKATKTIFVDAGGSEPARTRITVTGRVDPGDGPHLECIPSPLLFEKAGGTYGPALLRIANRGRAELQVTEIRCFGCEASLKVFNLGGGEEIEITVILLDGWTGNRWLEVVSNDPVQSTRKISLVVVD
jgi:hypothetical protein